MYETGTRTHVKHSTLPPREKETTKGRQTIKKITHPVGLLRNNNNNSSKTNDKMCVCFSRQQQQEHRNKIKIWILFFSMSADFLAIEKGEKKFAAAFYETAIDFSVLFIFLCCSILVFVVFLSFPSFLGKLKYSLFIFIWFACTKVSIPNLHSGLSICTQLEFTNESFFCFALYVAFCLQLLLLIEKFF